MTKADIVNGLFFCLKGVGILWGIILLYVSIYGNVITYRAWRQRSRQRASALPLWRLAWQRIAGGRPQPFVASNQPPQDSSPNP